MQPYQYASDFKHKSPEEVFDAILAWSDVEKCKDATSERPGKIEFVHGSIRTVSVWKRNAKKNLQFIISKTEDGTHVQVTASPGSMMYSDDIRTMDKEIYVNWGILLDEIWASIDGPDNVTNGDFGEMAAKLAEENKASGKSMLIIGSAIFVVGFLVALLFVEGIFISVIGFLMLFWGIVKYKFSPKPRQNS